MSSGEAGTGAGFGAETGSGSGAVGAGAGAGAIGGDWSRWQAQPLMQAQLQFEAAHEKRTKTRCA